MTPDIDRPDTFCISEGTADGHPCEEWEMFGKRVLIVFRGDTFSWSLEAGPASNEGWASMAGDKNAQRLAVYDTVRNIVVSYGVGQARN